MSNGNIYIFLALNTCDQSGVMASNDFGDWYRGIPQVSRYWFTASVVVPLIGKLGLVSPLTMILHWEMFAYHFQVM